MLYLELFTFCFQKSTLLPLKCKKLFAFIYGLEIANTNLAVLFIVTVLITLQRFLPTFVGNSDLVFVDTVQVLRNVSALSGKHNLHSKFRSYIGLFLTLLKFQEICFYFSQLLRDIGIVLFFNPLIFTSTWSIFGQPEPQRLAVSADQAWPDQTQPDLFQTRVQMKKVAEYLHTF